MKVLRDRFHIKHLSIKKILRYQNPNKQALGTIKYYDRKVKMAELWKYPDIGLVTKNMSQYLRLKI
jgi:hypothetical protein